MILMAMQSICHTNISNTVEPVLKKTYHSHVVKIFNFSDVSVKSGTVQYDIYCTFREANIDSRTTRLQSRFCVLDFASYFLSSTALELYVRQNLVKGLALRLQ